MSEITRQLDPDYGAASCLTYLIQSNRSLLENYVDERTVAIFVELIHSKGPQMQFLNVWGRLRFAHPLLVAS